MIEKTSTMQSEAIEETLLVCPRTPQSEKMTFSKTTPNILTPENLSPNIIDSNSESINKLTTQLLEDDIIEKVEINSNKESASSLSSLCIEDHKPDFSLLPDFSAIPEENSSESVKNWLKKITEVHNNNNNISSAKKPLVNNNNLTPTTTPSRVMKYQDLPYMGEITLDNSKPRRGRKPKKADICHLIYKNYGTIFPGTPNPNSYLEKATHATKKHHNHHHNHHHRHQHQQEKELQDIHLIKNDVQNKIISSLLEKRLTQESKKTSITNKIKADQNEPLNLCIRDLNHLNIHHFMDNNKTSPSEIKSEPQSDDDDIEIIPETPSSATNKSELRFPSVTPDSMSTSSPSDTPNTPESAGNNYVYWPNSGLFLHPMALQQQLMMYQKLAGNINYPLPSHSPRSTLSGVTSEKLETSSSDTLRKIVPKATTIKSSSNHVETVTLQRNHHHHQEKSKRNAITTCASEKQTPAKRKRSAIFIPPIPSENTTNPATEVSICKFKFTGGAKPSLQEKKMLSVDSGGNFRYYSGTGDKSMRGYEFFPRETLQQQINQAQGSSTGAFLQASGEKIYPAPPLDITGGSSTSDFLLQPELPGSSIAAIQQEVNHNNSLKNNNNNNKKRKSRKSVQREKLEQTFKEKGFLIQTQQLESAEGATYCKFRQLRKFTRYLFRSWKDYLPGNVQDLSESEQIRELQQAEQLQRGELLNNEVILDDSIKSAEDLITPRSS